MIIDISEDGRTIEWWSNGERKITTIYHLIDVYDGIVRCKDCKHRPIPNGTDHPLAPKLDGWSDYACPCLCDDEYYNFMPDDNDYCSRGERREDADSNTDTDHI